MSGLALLLGGSPPAQAAPPTGSVVAWGDNSSGQATVPSGLGTSVVAVSAGNAHSLALKSDGTVVAWGCSGQPAPNPCTVPAGLSGVVAIAAGGDSLALKSDGTVVEWPCSTCVPAGLGNVVAIADGSRQLALKRDGTVVPWGDTTGEVPFPTGLSGVTAIAVGGSHDLALKSDGTVVGWGSDSALQTTIPADLANVAAIAAGAFHSLALERDGTVRAWGCVSQFFNFGQCRVPAGLSGVVAVSAGGGFSLALKNDGSVVAWGLNAEGQTTVPPGLKGVLAISAGGQHALALVKTRPGSLALDGATGYAEVAASPDLNITGDWTVEAWFKDDDPAGFNHDFRQILMKGDRNANPEAPYFILVATNNITAGVRTGGTDYALSWDLVNLGLDPAAWHHVAVTFRADLNVLNLWLDGKHIAYLTVPAHSTVGNTLPLEIGRNGPATGKYWLGKLDDVRIWNVARQGTDITATYRTQLTSPQPGLVANWHFDEGSGTTAADSTAGHTATLHGGATFSPDVHP
jgi:hypothetical protein